jgi:adenylosuccinate synthase
MASVKVCVGYELDGRTVDSFPSDPALLERCQPIYEELPGWETSICSVSDFAELPDEAANVVRKLEGLVGTPAETIGVGPSRHQTIRRHNLWERRSR